MGNSVPPPREVNMRAQRPGAGNTPLPSVVKEAAALLAGGWGRAPSPFKQLTLHVCYLLCLFFLKYL